MLVTMQLEIQAPVETVFTYLDDQEKQKEWISGLESTEFVSPLDPTNPVGTKFKQRLREGGRIQEYEGQVTEYKRNNLLGIQLQHSAFLVEVIYRIEALTDKSCRLHLTEKIESKTLFGKLINILFSGIIKRTLKKQMTLLKNSAEMSSR
ncbi:SRPBCC family protein [Fictibacillus nanhaiensis]|uniref:SRPBCC family protein n=1 Tax=Fictibacillus nanhaiensis TaxID=742169 RepID=UPI002E24D6C3|nr:SRPBCC family protein [Fictibacillus nanhaiensis]